MVISPEAKKVLAWMGPQSAHSLEDIQQWCFPLSDVPVSRIETICHELIAAGLLKERRTADGAVLYSPA